MWLVDSGQILIAHFQRSVLVANHPHSANDAFIRQNPEQCQEKVLTLFESEAGCCYRIMNN